MQHSESLLQLTHTAIPLSPSFSVWQTTGYFYPFLYIFKHWWLNNTKATLLNKWKQLWCRKHPKIFCITTFRCHVAHAAYSNCFYMPLPGLLHVRDKLDAKWGESQWDVTSTRSHMESDPFTEAHLCESATSAKRGEIQNTYSGKLSRFSHPIPSSHKPPRQAVGRKHGNCLWSRKELLPCFLELSHDWDSSHISMRVFVSLHEHDLKRVTEMSFQAKKAV